MIQHGSVNSATAPPLQTDLAKIMQTVATRVVYTERAKPPHSVTHCTVRTGTVGADLLSFTVAAPVLLLLLIYLVTTIIRAHTNKSEGSLCRHQVGMPVEDEFTWMQAVDLEYGVTSWTLESPRLNLTHCCGFLQSPGGLKRQRATPWEAGSAAHPSSIRGTCGPASLTSFPATRKLIRSSKTRAAAAAASSSTQAGGSVH
eukprot:CAMPEP_0172860448 /NCGR_PEP_ID=MMETSP1075-20121228/72091_1 /TAXON_ID=2916 /ORGANISM="Ceratium fusus, Strain PA161109" /LENGTH=200 /DNA_ID=CAMNT_0013708475 /DNA_START=139 /DNA_END=743 /DNA_ORIENTATION=+